MWSLKSSLHLFPKASSVLLVPFIFVPLHACVLQVVAGFLGEIYFCLSNFYKAEKWSGLSSVQTKGGGQNVFKLH